jgi:hypothetical protein
MKMTNSDNLKAIADLTMRQQRGEFARQPQIFTDSVNGFKSTITTDLLDKLADIWQAYLDNELDDEARRYHGGKAIRHENTTPPEDIELYQGRGSRRLLTLADCRDAFNLLHIHRITEQPVLPAPTISATGETTQVSLEYGLVEDLANIWNTFLLLPVEHPDDNTEFRQGIHRLQEKILARLGRRNMRHSR